MKSAPQYCTIIYTLLLPAQRDDEVVSYIGHIQVGGGE